jgi:hypothetical protein
MGQLLPFQDPAVTGWNAPIPAVRMPVGQPVRSTLGGLATSQLPRLFIFI